MKLPILLALFLGPLSLPRAAGIDWQPAFDAALERAREERRVVFLVVNMDGERANDALAEKVYVDKRIRELAAATVPLVASVAQHSEGRECPRFGAIPCSAHRAVDVAARSKVLKPDVEGWVVAPQHVLLSPDGEVILSVPYELSEGELEWCLVTAIRSVDPEFRWRLGAGANAPQRLILGGVYELGPDGSRVLTRERVLELIAEIKKGTMDYDARQAALRDVLSADEPEALEFIRTELRGARGGGGRFGGGGDQGSMDPRARILHQIGVHSPRSYWEVAAEYAEGGEPGLRVEAIVALEQLAAPQSLKVLQTALRKEKDPRIEKNVLRALGSAGASDSGARSTLVKAATKEKDPLLRRNAVVALGSLVPDDELRELLGELLAAEEDLALRTAAACAMGMSRDASWLGALEAARENAAAAGEAELVAACEAAAKVLSDGGLAPLREPLQSVCEDRIERERLFGFAFD